jgi:hypothetical protein
VLSHVTNVVIKNGKKKELYLHIPTEAGTTSFIATPYYIMHQSNIRRLPVSSSSRRRKKIISPNLELTGANSYLHLHRCHHEHNKAEHGTCSCLASSEKLCKLHAHWQHLVNPACLQKPKWEHVCSPSHV